MQVAMRRKGLIALGIFVGLCLGLLYYAQATPIYESVAMLSIDEKAPPMPCIIASEGVWDFCSQTGLTSTTCLGATERSM